MNLCTPHGRGYTTYVNQSIVKISKSSVKGKLFLQVSADDTDRDLSTLGKSALRLWFYLMTHKDGFEFALSPAAIKNAIGLGRDGYKAGRKELIEKGYLQHIRGNFYILHSSPVKVESKASPQPPREQALPWEETPVDIVEKSSIDGGKSHIEIVKNNKRIINNNKNTEDVFSIFSSSGDDITEVESKQHIIYNHQKENGEDSVSTGNYVEPFLSEEEADRLNRIEDIKASIYAKERAIRNQDLDNSDIGIFLKQTLAFIFYRYSGDGEKMEKLLNNAKYGIVVDGWDSESEQPIIKCAPVYVPPTLMKQNPDKLKEVLYAGYIKDMSEDEKDEATRIMKQWDSGYKRKYYTATVPKFDLSDDGDDGELPF